MLVGGLLAGGYVFRVLARRWPAPASRVQSCRRRGAAGRGAGAGARARCCSGFVPLRLVRPAADRPAGCDGGAAMNGAGTLAPVLLRATLGAAAGAAAGLPVAAAAATRMPALLVLAPLPGPGRGAAGLGGPPLVLDHAAARAHAWRSTCRARCCSAWRRCCGCAAGVYAVDLSCAAAAQRALRRVLAADADRQPRRLHGGRPRRLLSSASRWSACAAYGPDRARRDAARRGGPAASIWRLRCWARPSCCWASCCWRPATPRRQPADPRRRGGAARIALARSPRLALLVVGFGSRSGWCRCMSGCRSPTRRRRSRPRPCSAARSSRPA